jgi:hypothetical protein
MKTLSVEDFSIINILRKETLKQQKKIILLFIKAWIRKKIPERKDETTLDWVLVNQNEILLKLMESRSDKNRSLETFRRDVSVILKFLK